MRQPTIEITLTDEVGKRETVKINTEQRFSHAPAPDVCDIPGIGDTFDSCIAKMKKREYRKDEILGACIRLGGLLQDRLCDKEGWHGEERANRFKATKQP